MAASDGYKMNVVLWETLWLSRCRLQRDTFQFIATGFEQILFRVHGDSSDIFIHGIKGNGGVSVLTFKDTVLAQCIMGSKGCQ